MARKHGYSPMQHVFGCEMKFPGITGEDAAYAPGTRQYHAGDECARASAGEKIVHGTSSMYS